jgi:NodT family efflux transporter outer membrane factor (OMF) lipoprotein
MKAARKFIAIVLFGLLAGCTVGPTYRPPAIKAQPQWSPALAGGETTNSGSVAFWWKNFNDPELDSLIERAVISNLDLRIAAARVREARAQFRVTAADLWPSVGTSASYERQLQSMHQPLLGSIPLPANVPFENNVYQAGFDASWEIDVFGGKRRATEAAKAEVAASEFGRRDTLVTLLGEVSRNYVDARATQRRLTIARENIKAQEDDLVITQDRFKHGLTSDLDVRQAATLEASTRADVPTLEISLHVSIHRLGVLLGQPPGALMAELSAVAPIPAAPPEVPVGLPSELLLRRPDVQQAERQLAAATAQIGVATADLFPKFSLTGAAGFQSVSASDWFAGASKFWSLGPTVQWNVFDAGRIRGNIKVQNARQEQALATYEKTVLGSFEDVENALVSYAKEQVRRRSLDEAVNHSQESLRLANQLYANGLANFINVLDAERSLYQAQDQLVQSERAVSVNLISLYKSLGGGWNTAAR